MNKKQNSKEKYCNLKPKKCAKKGEVYSDDDGYICATCGKRVSKWVPIIAVLKKSIKINRRVK